MLVVIVGATGTGKSTLALDLADCFRAEGRAAEIVNADAMQLYRGMDIGTAKVPVGDRRGIPHHLLDVIDPSTESSVARYQSEARAVIEAIVGRGAVPVLVGGSGLYVSSVVYDFSFPGTDPVIRARLEAELITEGPGILSRRLALLDPTAAEAIGPYNGRRIVRALEVVEMTGKPFGSGLPDESSSWMPMTTIGLSTPREELVERLDARVEQMWIDGLVEEAGRLRVQGLGATASRAIGYSQALEHLAGALTAKEAIEQTQILTRKYARRQVGWFRRYPATTWLESNRDDLVKATRQLLLDNA